MSARNVRFSPEELFQLTGASPDSLRDWRRRRLLSGVGKRGADSRWTYSARDALVIACAQAFADSRIALEDAFSAARNLVVARAFVDSIKKSGEFAIALSRNKGSSENSTFVAKATFEEVGRFFDEHAEFRAPMLFSTRQIKEQFSTALIAAISAADL